MAAVLIAAHHMANVAEVWVAGAMALSGAAAVTYFHIAQIAVRNRINRLLKKSALKDVIPAATI